MISGHCLQCQATASRFRCTEKQLHLALYHIYPYAQALRIWVKIDSFPLDSKVFFHRVKIPIAE
jgi:hypothetical protein